MSRVFRSTSLWAKEQKSPYGQSCKELEQNLALYFSTWYKRSTLLWAISQLSPFEQICLCLFLHKSDEYTEMFLRLSTSECHPGHILFLWIVWRKHLIILNCASFKCMIFWSSILRKSWKKSCKFILVPVWGQTIGCGGCVWTDWKKLFVGISREGAWFWWDWSWFDVDMKEELVSGWVFLDSSMYIELFAIEFNSSWLSLSRLRAVSFFKEYFCRVSCEVGSLILDVSS